MAQVRLNKIIADAGIASRRAADKLIEQGRVTINGKVVLELGIKADPKIDDIKVNGESLSTQKSKTYLAFNKPRGVISTMSDPDGRENLGDYFKGRKDRLFHVGRLDKESEGLILLTNDGDFAHKATHPSFGLEKRYLVEVEGDFNKQIADQMLQGVKLEDGLARALKVTPTRAVNKNHHWVEIVIHEGRYHIIRRLIESFDLRVLRLIRTEFGPISLSDMKSGRYRILHGPELTKLLNLLRIRP
jgi:23S rRNA pseudouridine2605 synthase